MSNCSWICLVYPQYAIFSDMSRWCYLQTIGKLLFGAFRKVDIKVGMGRAILSPGLVMIAKCYAMEQPQDVVSPRGGHAFMEIVTLWLWYVYMYMNVGFNMLFREYKCRSVREKIMYWNWTLSLHTTSDGAETLRNKVIMQSKWKILKNSQHTDFMKL